MTDYTIAVVQDAVNVLDSFNQAQKGLTLTEIVDKTGLGKNKVFRILYTLEQTRMVYRDENHKFHLGFRVSELAQNVRPHSLLLDISNPVMEQLLDETQESIILGVASGHHALCIATQESPRSMRLYARVGIQSPLYMGGVPKVLLANMSRLQREKHLRYFEANVDDASLHWGEMRRKLAKIRQQGYSITVDELDIGAHSITAPVFDSSGQVIAGMSIAGPSIRFTADKIKRYIDLVTAAALRISIALGYNPGSDAAPSHNQKTLPKLIESTGGHAKYANTL